MAPSIFNSHPGEGRGLWTQTATIDWCEANYDLSYYIAEFWNTLSNFAFIIPQLVSFITLLRNEHFEKVFLTAYISTIIVGVGSLCFHMTLSRPMQMLDETSMIVVSLHSFYLLYIIKEPSTNRKLLATSLICYGLIFLALYVLLVEWPVFHHSAFGLLVYVSIILAYKLKKIHGHHYKFWRILILQHVGFGFWLIDKHYCEILTQFRQNHVPMFFKPLFQFHALWHLFMGISSHLFICAILKLRAWLKHKQIFVIRYRWLGLLITLERQESKTNHDVLSVHSHSQSYNGCKKRFVQVGS